MLQTITIIGTNQKAYDIQADSSQRIKTTLRVLRESMNEFSAIPENVTVRVKQSGRFLNIQKTYEEEQIYAGAELLLLSEESEGGTENAGEN